MDLTRCLRGLCAFFDRPSSDLLLACGEVRDKSEQRVAFLDKSVKSALLKSEVVEEHCLFIVVHLNDLFLDLRANRQHA